MASSSKPISTASDHALLDTNRPPTNHPATWEIVAADGAESYSLHKLASALNVKVPSLYRYVKGKVDVLRVVNLQTWKQLLEVMEAAQSLAALRGLLSLVHGFVMVELNKQLRCGGSLEEAFALSAAAYLRGWELSS